MPCGHHVELFLAAFKTAPRHAAHLAGGAIAEQFVEQGDGLRHVDELSGLRFADDLCHPSKSSQRSITQGIYRGKTLRI